MSFPTNYLFQGLPCKICVTHPRLNCGFFRNICKQMRKNLYFKMRLHQKYILQGLPRGEIVDSFKKLYYYFKYFLYLILKFLEKIVYLMCLGLIFKTFFKKPFLENVLFKMFFIHSYWKTDCRTFKKIFPEK